MIIRTVLDLRPQVPKFVFQTLLLTASWHRFSAHHTPLEIFTLGKASEPLHAFLSSLGAHVQEIQPNANDGFSKTSNTIQGAEHDPRNRVLLLDNDVVLSKDIGPLKKLATDTMYGSASGNIRVGQPQWDHIAETLDLYPLSVRPVIPPTSQMNSLITHGSDVEPLDIAYVNGGVLLLPTNAEFAKTWTKHQRAIFDAFEKHPLANGAVRGSNMAALATTIHDHEKFDWLPIGYNYRHSCFALGMEDVESIYMVHMTGFADKTDTTSLSDWIQEYWEEKIASGIHRLSHLLEDQETERRRFIANAVRDNITKTVKDYDLDKIVQDMGATGVEQA